MYLGTRVLVGFVWFKVVVSLCSRVLQAFVKVKVAFSMYISGFRWFSSGLITNINKSIFIFKFSIYVPRYTVFVGFLQGYYEMVFNLCSRGFCYVFLVFMFFFLFTLGFVRV